MRRRLLVTCTAIGVFGAVAAWPLVGAAQASPAPGDGGAGQSWQVKAISTNPVIHLDGKSFALTNPDDLTHLGRNIFVNYQNGVGPQGQPATDGVDFSTIVEYEPWGGIVATWDLTGKSDGLSADTDHGRLIATVNEDANTSLYTIDPDVASDQQVVHYQYSPDNPLPHGGGTDAISVYNGHILISASAPGTVTGSGTTPATMPAVYQARLTTTGPGVGTAFLSPVFFDGSEATVANTAPPTASPVSPNPPSYGSVPPLGTSVALNLTDPDSNEIVPGDSPRFAGDFVLDSQGDEQLIFDNGVGTDHQHLSLLDLSQSVDDSAYISDWGGAIYLTDPTANEVVRVSGPLRPGQVFVSGTPEDANNQVSAPAYVGSLDLQTGTVSSVPGLSSLQPQGMIFVAPGDL